MDSKDYLKTFFSNNKLTIIVTIIIYIFNSLLNIVVSYFLQVLLDTLSIKSSEEINKLTISFCMIVVFIFILTLIKYFSYPKFLETAMLQYRDKAFKNLLNKNISSFSNEKTSTYISAFTNDMIAIQDKYLKNIFNLIQMIIMLVGALALMFYYNITLTFIAIGLSILPFLSSVLLGGKMAEKEKLVSESNEVYVSTLKDILLGFSTIKTFQSEDDVDNQFYNTSKKLEANKKNANRTEELIIGIGGIASIIAQVGVMLIGAYFVLNDSNLVTIGMLLAFTNLMNFVIQPLAAIPQILAERKSAKKLISKLSDNLNNNIVESGKDLRITDNTPPIIKLENVTYNHSDGNVGLMNVSYEFKPGKIYAIVGASGSGKSTLLNMLLKSNVDYTGNICINDSELKEINSKSIYNIISLIQQEVFIFDNNIENNITMFKKFPQEQIEKAIEESGLASLIKTKGQGFKVGENGNNLSGGERQRISIARSLIRKSSVLLVDEATSALDNETANQINQTLNNLNNTTRIVVTHRLDSQNLCNFDEILVMKKGKIIESGDFNYLMNKKGYLYSMYMIDN